MEEIKGTKEGFTQKLGEAILLGLPADGNLNIVFGEQVKPLQLRDETPVKLIGILDSPARWLEARKDLLYGLKCYVMVERESLLIELIIEERNHFKDLISGTLTYHPAFLKFGINNEKYITPAAMADKIKMNRSFFENKQVAMNLVTQLVDFKATVNREIEKKDDKRGNYKDLMQQAVSSNLPESFKMRLPIFKGEKARVLEVEVYIEAENLTCCLVSPEANEEMELLRDTAIDGVLERIKIALPAIVILEK